MPRWPARSRSSSSSPDGVLDALGEAYEQWDGHGWPGRIGGDDVPLAARLAQISEFVEVANRVGGSEAAAEVARARKGKQFDPELAQIVCDQSAALVAGLDSIVTWDAVIDGGALTGGRALR